MRIFRCIAAGVAVVAGITAVVWTQAPPAAGQGETYRAPRTVEGRPDLNGIWQAMSSAHYDLEAHPARPAMALVPSPPRNGIPGLTRATPIDLPAPGIRALGAVGGVPAGDGV